MNVVHAVPSLKTAAGGIAATVPALVSALFEEGIESRIFAHDADPGLDCIRIKPALLVRTLETDLMNHLDALGATDSWVLHNHGLWQPLNWAMSRVALRLGMPQVISPHGMLLPWARQHRWLRKTLAWSIYQKQIFDQSDQVHVTSDAEAESLRRYGQWPVTVLPFGVAGPPGAPKNERVNEAVSGIDVAPGSGRRMMLFLGRLHRIKNLENLVRAWASVSPAGWELVIAGPDEGNLVSGLEKLTAGAAVSFPGPVYGEAKWRILKEAGVLVLPSFSENFGAVVVEALMSGTPVITSTGTPWRELEAAGCGWHTAPDQQALEAVISLVTSLPAENLAGMEEIARRYGRQHYSWAACAPHFRKLYDSLLTRH